MIQTVTPPLLILSVLSLKYLRHTKQFCLSSCIFILITEAVVQWSQKRAQKEGGLAARKWIRRRASEREQNMKNDALKLIEMHSDARMFYSIGRQESSSTARARQMNLHRTNLVPLHPQVLSLKYKQHLSLKPRTKEPKPCLEMLGNFNRSYESEFLISLLKTSEASEEHPVTYYPAELTLCDIKIDCFKLSLSTIVVSVGSKVTVGCITGLQQGRRDGSAIISSPQTEGLPPKGLKVEQGGFTALPSGHSHQGEEIRKIIALFVNDYTHWQAGFPDEFLHRNNQGAT